MRISRSAGLLLTCSTTIGVKERSVWWEFYRLVELSAEDLIDERGGLSGLIYVGEAGGTARAPIHRYRFPPQETQLRGDEDLHNLGGAKLGKIAAISPEILRLILRSDRIVQAFIPKPLSRKSLLARSQSRTPWCESGSTWPVMD